MPKLPTLVEIQNNIREKVMAENLIKQGNGDNQQLFNAMAIVPEHNIWKTVTWIHENILPKVKLHRGENSEEYKNYVQIRDSLLWAIYILNKNERTLLQLQNSRFMEQLYREKMMLFEKELLKYATAEELINTETLSAYQNTILKQAVDMLNEKSNKKEP